MHWINVVKKHIKQKCVKMNEAVRLIQAREWRKGLLRPTGIAEMTGRNQREKSSGAVSGTVTPS